jgi:hypothetical protein
MAPGKYFTVDKQHLDQLCRNVPHIINPFEQVISLRTKNKQVCLYCPV